METTYTESEVRKMLERLQDVAKQRHAASSARYHNVKEDYWKGSIEGEMYAYSIMQYNIETELIALRRARPITVGK